MLTESFKSIDILLVEDSPTDVLITREALAQAKLINTMHVVQDGVKAMDYLYRRGEYARAPHPDLVILDLNLPRKNGREVLAEIKADENLKLIPVVVLTTSSAEEDVIKAYGLHANCYVVKPMDFDSFVQIVRDIGHFWFHVVSIPPEVDNA
jgi:two-component system, chemotaxis family, response regulator Rcp1